MIESWKQSGLVAIVVIAAMVIGGGLQMWSLDQGQVTSAGAATTTATPPAVAATTGIPDLDRIIAILTSGDVAAVKGILIETPSPCVVNPQGIHNPPACPDGVAAGTLLPVFRASAGEAVWPGDLDQVLDNTVTRNRALYGVRVNIPIPSQQWVPAGQYGVVLVDPSQMHCSLFFVTLQGVVGAIFVPCSSLPVVLDRYPSRGDIVPLRVELPPTPTPVPAIPTPSPIGIDWSHRLAVYTAQTRVKAIANRSVPVRAVVTWDVTAGKPAAFFEYNQDGEGAVGAELAGRTLVFATESRVEEAAPDGTGQREIFVTSPGESVQDIAVSPDGRLVAVVSNAEDTSRQGVLRLFDLQTLQQRLVVPQSDSRFAAMWGHFGEVQWRGDGAGVLVGTLTNTEMWGALATVFLDGRIRIEDVQGYGNVSPTGRMRAGDIGAIGCMFVGAHQLVVNDLEAGQTPLSMGGSSTVYTPWEWSPDGSQFVFLRQEATTCDELSPEKQVAYVVRTNGTSFPGAPMRVSDLAALHRDWYGNNLFTADCENGNEPVADRSGEPRPLCYSQPGPGPYQAVTVRLGGQSIGTAVDPVPVGVITP